MTPWAELLVRPLDNDLFIRQRFHALVSEQHPDRDGADGQPGPRWYALVAAYTAAKTEAGRADWQVQRAKLARLCESCKGLGIEVRRIGKDKGVKVCAACKGEGRRAK